MLIYSIGSQSRRPAPNRVLIFRPPSAKVALVGIFQRRLLVVLARSFRGSSLIKLLEVASRRALSP